MTMTESQPVNTKFTVSDSDSSATASGSAYHVPPPATSRLNGGTANTKTRSIQAIANTVLTDNRPGKLADGSDSASNKPQVSYVGYTFYKTLLAVMFFFYGMFRYCQLQYNRCKLKIFDILNSPSNIPQLIRQDVVKLAKIPSRLAAILEMKPVGDVGGGLHGLLNDASEVVCWTISAGVKHLTLYDHDGAMQRNIDQFRNEVYEHLSMYYGPDNVPNYAVKIPHYNQVFYNRKDSPVPTDKHTKVAIEVSILSNRDGRQTIVDLTRTMAELCSAGDLDVGDITVDLVDSELKQLVGPEPDLLLYFGPALDLQGFPPWHIRLTEFFWEEDNNQVTYSVFIRGLKQYAGCKVNVGK